MAAGLLRLIPVSLELLQFRTTPNQPAPRKLLQRRNVRRLRILDPQGWKIRRQVGRDQLVDALRFAQAAQLVQAEIAQRRPAGELCAEALGGRSRKQRLAAMARGRDALGTHQGKRRDVCAVVRFRRADVQADAHPHGTDFAPALLVQGALRVEGRAERLVGVVKHRAEGIADDLEHLPAVRIDCTLQQHVMPRERNGCSLRMLLDQARRALDIGEQEGDDAIGQAAHAGNRGADAESKRVAGQQPRPISTETRAQRKRPLAQCSRLPDKLRSLRWRARRSFFAGGGPCTISAATAAYPSHS